MARRPCRYGKLKHPVGRRRCKKKPHSFPSAHRGSVSARDARGRFLPRSRGGSGGGEARSIHDTPRGYAIDERVRGSYRYSSEGKLAPSDERVRGRYRWTPDGWALAGGRRRKKKRKKFLGIF